MLWDGMDEKEKKSRGGVSEERDKTNWLFSPTHSRALNFDKVTNGIHDWKLLQATERFRDIEYNQLKDVHGVTTIEDWQCSSHLALNFFFFFFFAHSYFVRPCC